MVAIHNNNSFLEVGHVSWVSAKYWSPKEVGRPEQIVVYHVY